MRSVGLFSFAWSSHSLTEAPAAFGSACAATSPKSLNPASGNALLSAIAPGAHRSSRKHQLGIGRSSVGTSRTEVSRMDLKLFTSLACVRARRAGVILSVCILPLLTTACANNQQEPLVWQFGSTSFEPVASTAPNTEAASEAYDTPTSVSDDASTEPSSATEWRTYVHPAAIYAYRGDAR